jgi:hypothetical protein
MFSYWDTYCTYYCCTFSQFFNFGDTQWMETSNNTVIQGEFSSELVSRATIRILRNYLPENESLSLWNTKSRNTWSSEHPRCLKLYDRVYGVISLHFTHTSWEIALILFHFSSWATCTHIRRNIYNHLNFHFFFLTMWRLYCNMALWVLKILLIRNNFCKLAKK